MTAIAAEDVGAARGDGGFVDSLVARLHVQYGVEPEAIRVLAGEVLASFAGARVQAFVPILVEKRLHEVYRRISARPGLTVLPTPTGL